MNGGSTIVEFWRDKSIATTGESQKDEALLLEQVVEDADTDDEAVERRDPFDRRTQAIFGLAALLWLGFAGWATISTHQWQAGPAAWPGLVTTMLLPVVGLGVCYLLLARTSRAESRRYLDAARVLHTEAEQLEARLNRINRQLATARDAMQDSRSKSMPPKLRRRSWLKSKMNN